MAAVEFALLLPLMALLYLGGFEATQMLAVKRQVTLTASTVANIVTQYSSISDSETMPGILAASGAVLTPYSASKAVVTVSYITIDSSGNATITWSRSLNGTQRPKGQVVTLPAALDVPNTNLVWGETTYAYTPTVDYANFGTINLYSSIFMLPRLAGGITLTT
jgi:Flp pilus assembly protein TadG